jgi:hypothetical protein
MRAIQLDPNASEGAAFVTLGSLYYMVPGWPIAYGDTNKADAFNWNRHGTLKIAYRLLLFALRRQKITIEIICINGVRVNNQRLFQQCICFICISIGNRPTWHHLIKRSAVAIPVRKNQEFADNQLHKQAKLAIMENSQFIATK